jgi:hypothetical protein
MGTSEQRGPFLNPRRDRVDKCQGEGKPGYGREENCQRQVIPLFYCFATVLRNMDLSPIGRLRPAG